jgi:hypothetical protein
MSPFEALYGWPCRRPLSCSESGERVIFGPNIVIEAKGKVRQIWAKKLTAQPLQKSYTDKRCYALEFQVVVMYTFESLQWKVYIALA